MDTKFLLIGGAAIAAYFFLFKDDVPAPAGTGSGSTGSGATGTGANPQTGAGNNTTGNPVNNQNPPATTGPVNSTLTLVQRLIAASNNASALTLDQWNHYYKIATGTTQDQPAPEDFPGFAGNERNGQYSAAQYLQMRNLSGLGGISGVGYLYRRRNF